MAKETKNAGTTAAEHSEHTPASTKAPKESVYKVSELAANAKTVFGTRPECVMAALREDGKEEYTVSEAKTAVQKFLKKEVK